MDEGIAKLIIGVVLVIAAVYAVVLIVVAAVVLAAILAPPVGAGYWLRNLLTRRYHFGPRRTAKCIFVGLGTAAIVWLSVVFGVPPSEYAAAVATWMSITGCLLGIGLYLSLSAYREIFWPHRKKIIAATRESLRLRLQLWKHGFRLNRVNAAIRDIEQREGSRLTEIRQLEQNISEIVHSIDPAFLSAERVRWQIECSNLDENALRQQLENVQSEMRRTDPSSPRFPTLVVQASVIRLNAQKRAMDVGTGASYEANDREQEQLRTVIGGLREHIHDLQQQASDAYSSLRHLKQQRLFIQ